MKLTYKDQEITIEQAVELELTPDAYSVRKRKERVNDLLAGIIQCLASKSLLTANDLNNIFQDVSVEDE